MVCFFISRKLHHCKEQSWLIFLDWPNKTEKVFFFLPIKGCDRRSAEDWRPTLEGTKMLLCWFSPLFVRQCAHIITLNCYYLLGMHFPLQYISKLLFAFFCGLCLWEFTLSRLAIPLGGYWRWNSLLVPQTVRCPLFCLCRHWYMEGDLILKSTMEPVSRVK